MSIIIEETKDCFLMSQELNVNLKNKNFTHNPICF